MILVQRKFNAKQFSEKGEARRVKSSCSLPICLSFAAGNIKHGSGEGVSRVVVVVSKV